MFQSMKTERPPCLHAMDLKNQMTEAHGPFGVFKVEYDALGRGIEKQSAGRAIRFVWCGVLLGREIVTTLAGESAREYLYRPGSYEPLALRVDGACYYYHNDHQGTPQRLTDTQGKVLWSARYLVWSARYFAFGYAQGAARARRESTALGRSVRRHRDWAALQPSSLL